MYMFWSLQESWKQMALSVMVQQIGMMPRKNKAVNFRVAESNCQGMLTSKMDKLSCTS